jgi:hypothetical protein
MTVANGDDLEYYIHVPIYVKPGIHDTSFASKSPFKKT